MELWLRICTLLNILRNLLAQGKKNYAYKIVNTTKDERKAICKVRGITLNYNPSQLVNFDAIRDMVLEKSGDP